MKKPQQSEVQDIKEELAVRTITHKGIQVHIGIDYRAGKVSLAEWKPDMTWDKKEYIFANRGLSYMQGWLDILDAMRVAVEYGKKELEKRKDEMEATVEKDLMRMVISK